MHYHKLSKHNWCKYCDEEFENKLQVTKHLMKIHGKYNETDQIKIESKENDDNNSNEQDNV